ncbi:MAG: 4-oxalomesaconate tautomerase, partial [Actinomycetota bacterium]|nr:4-oxalomesaconate tautomerase [Actinomycetota bacterium]
PPVATTADGPEATVSVEHPSGEFSVTLGLDPDDPTSVTRSALLRTARLIMAGQAMVPHSVAAPTEKASA